MVSVFSQPRTLPQLDAATKCTVFRINFKSLILRWPVIDVYISAATKSKLVVMFTFPALKCTWLLIPTIPAKISSTGNFGTPHDSLSRPSSWFRISRFLPLKGWQVRKLDTPWCLHKMIPCIGVSALRALVIRVTIKQIKGKAGSSRWQRKRQMSVCTTWPRFTLLVAYRSVRPQKYTWRLPWRWGGKRRIQNLPNQHSFPPPPLPLEYLLSAGVVNNPNAKTRSNISFWPKQNR